MEVGLYRSKATNTEYFVEKFSVHESEGQWPKGVQRKKPNGYEIRLEGGWAWIDHGDYVVYFRGEPVKVIGAMELGREFTFIGALEKREEDTDEDRKKDIARELIERNEQGRFAVPSRVFDDVLSMVRRKIEKVIADKGDGAFVTTHEAVGSLKEEFEKELMDAVHANNLDAFYLECIDVAVSAVWAAASMIAHKNAGRLEEFQR